MNLKESFNNLLENLKFTFYSHEEMSIDTLNSTSQTSVPEQQEYANFTYNPFGSYTSSDFSQQMLFMYNRQELIRRWREISFLPEVNSAIREITNEAIVYDDIEEMISINLSNIDLPDSIKDKIQLAFDKILYLLDFSECANEIFRQWYIDGVLNFEVIYDNDRLREGIKKLILLSPKNFHMFYDKDTHEKKYAFTNIQSVNSAYLRKNGEDKIFYDEQIASINSGEYNIDKTFPISFLNPALKTINQLSNIEDTLVIARLTKSIEKRVFKIPVRDLPKSKAEEYIRSLMMKYRQKKIYNTDTGTIENKNRAISVLEDFWIPVQKDGSSMSIENLPGITTNFGSFEDVDYLVNKLYKALNVPVNRRLTESRLTQNNTIDIEKEELRFFKFILQLRKRFNNLFIDLLKKELISTKVLSLYDWIKIQEKIKFVYANSNQYSEIKNNQILSMRIDAANSAIGLIDGGLIDKFYVQTNILRLTEEQIQQMEERKIQEKQKNKQMKKEEPIPEEQTEEPQDELSSEFEPEMEPEAQESEVNFDFITPETGTQ